MTDHPDKTQDDPKPASTLPEGSQQDASKDELGAVKADLVKQRQKAAELQKQLDALNAQPKNTDPEPPQPPAQDDNLQARLDKIERQNQMRELMSEHDMDARQADAVADLMKIMPGLDAAEAKLLAAQRNQELFSDTAPSSGFDQSVHGTARPTAGSVPVSQDDGPDTEARLKYIESLKASGNKKEHRRYLNNLVGNIAAQQLGKSGHKRLPIPK